MNLNPVWLNSYPEGVPAHIDPTAYNSLVGLDRKSVV
jgi:long-chain acyl-CoA synthetase